MDKEWITTREAIEIVGYQPYHLRRLIRDGKIKSQKFGTVWQVNRQSLLDYLQEAQDSTDGGRGPKR